MKITELIEYLKNNLEMYGDVEVELTGYYGDPDGNTYPVTNIEKNCSHSIILEGE